MMNVRILIVTYKVEKQIMRDVGTAGIFKWKDVACLTIKKEIFLRKTGLSVRMRIYD